jgi:hypothetical protein
MTLNSAFKHNLIKFLNSAMITVRIQPNSMYSLEDSGTSTTWGNLRWDQVMAYLLFVGPHYDNVQVVDVDHKKVFHLVKQLKAAYGGQGLDVTAVVDVDVAVARKRGMNAETVNAVV